MQYNNDNSPNLWIDACQTIYYEFSMMETRLADDKLKSETTYEIVDSWL
jgi:hypothetical protein